ncbi:hypothetical protein G7046_g1285 [Stylonectria norvegica]|nr:hypothetical protein G7046_g1285 [Stylonectria norvegica]
MNFFGGKSKSFDAKTDIPSLKDKVILVTGGNSGLGKQAVLEYARHRPSLIWLASRNLEKAKAAANDIRQQVPDVSIEILEMDLASLESVKKAAKTFLAKSDRLDILMLNAGIMATPPGLTEDGYEIQFGTNHMGHALLAKLLLPILKKTASSGADVRVVSLSSAGHTLLPKGTFSFDSLKSQAEDLSTLVRYAQGKLSNILWAKQFAKEHPELTVAAVHPGVVNTNLMVGATATPYVLRVMVKLFGGVLKTVEQGTKNQLWASISTDVQSGQYYEPIGVENMASADGKDDRLAKEIWDWTEKELELFLQRDVRTLELLLTGHIGTRLKAVAKAWESPGPSLNELVLLVRRHLMRDSDCVSSLIRLAGETKDSVSTSHSLVVGSLDQPEVIMTFEWEIPQALKAGQVEDVSNPNTAAAVLSKVDPGSKGLDLDKVTRQQPCFHPGR